MKISLRRIFSYQYLYVFIEILFVSNMYTDFLKHSSLADYMHPKFCWFQLKCILEIIAYQYKTKHNKTIMVPFVFWGFSYS